jgi:hypothetical protein
VLVDRDGGGVSSGQNELIGDCAIMAEDTLNPKVLMMTTQQLEARLATLEQEIAQVKQMLAPTCQSPAVQPWWEKIAGSFADDPDFDEAERLGREWRKSAQDDWLDMPE